MYAAVWWGFAILLGICVGVVNIGFHKCLHFIEHGWVQLGAGRRHYAVNVKPNGAAALAGVANGDLIVSINGTGLVAGDPLATAITLLRAATNSVQLGLGAGSTTPMKVVKVGSWPVRCWLQAVCAQVVSSFLHQRSSCRTRTHARRTGRRPAKRART